jgi:RNA polymerase sigma-70 factor (ECF subfamily)
LRRWARGKLPRWARTVNDTADIVQDALLQTFRRMDRFEDRGKGALQAYLRRVVWNRITDEMRTVGRQPALAAEYRPDDLISHEPSAYQLAFSAEQEAQYKSALATLAEDERLLVVGRMELGLNYDQLALLTNRRSPDAARVAVRRAVIKLARRMTEV